MIKKIFHSTLLVAITVLFASFVTILGVLYNHFNDSQEKQLHTQLELVSTAVENEGITYLENLDTDDFRVTYINVDGTVLYDSQVSVDTMENHSEREEIQEAFTTGFGESSRYSTTLTERTIYLADRLENGNVLRISVSSYTVFSLILELMQMLILIFVFAVILSSILAKNMAKRIVNPLNELDLDHPLENDSYDELSPLLKRIELQHSQIKQQMKNLKRTQNEFEAIVNCMNEGLVLLNNKGVILSINPAARKLFNTNEECVGNDFLTVDRTHEIHVGIADATQKGHSEIRIERNQRIYQFDFSRIEADNRIIGIVLLTFDVTEQANAEQTRREFTANVSHELKTPLQSIMGSAELIENGLVKAEDMPRFIGHIRSEASRLLTLIEDIIRLSQLDEGNEMPKENVDLYRLGEEVLSSLQDTATKKNIQLSIEGTHETIYCVKHLLSEVLFNLCDNAIKYNVQDGFVKITVSSDSSYIRVAVTDNGIGIAPEHHARIFERFYRVDKSHSKESGGTGLGLSIVKHAVMYHNGKIDMISESGKGTTMFMTFPK